jgi:malonyl CoA-acyl carrier protein transacylase
MHVAIETPASRWSEMSMPKPLLSADELRADIKAQMQSRVRWTESVQLMIGNGIQTCVEAGSGEVLLGLIKRIDPSTERYPLGSPQDFMALSRKSAILLSMNDITARVQRAIDE